MGYMQVEVGSTAEAYRILRHSCRQERKRAPTGANDWSSRSHSVVTIALYMPEIDLPGSAPADGQAASTSGESGIMTVGHARVLLLLQRGSAYCLACDMAYGASPHATHIKECTSAKGAHGGLFLSRLEGCR